MTGTHGIHTSYQVETHELICKLRDMIPRVCDLIGLTRMMQGQYVWEGISERLHDVDYDLMVHFSTSLDVKVNQRD